MTPHGLKGGPRSRGLLLCRLVGFAVLVGEDAAEAGGGEQVRIDLAVPEDQQQPPRPPVIQAAQVGEHGGHDRRLEGVIDAHEAGFLRKFVLDSVRADDLEGTAALAIGAIASGALGFAGNWLAALIRSRAGHRSHSPALVADGAHARADAYVSLAAIASAAAVALGLEILDPLVGLAITLVILRITWQSWQTVRGPHEVSSA
jgi:hypothetical protein